MKGVADIKTKTTAEAALLRYVAAKAAWRQARKNRGQEMRRPCHLVPKDVLMRAREDGLKIGRICPQKHEEYYSYAVGPSWFKSRNTSGFCPPCQAAWQANIAYREAAIELTAAQNSIVAVAKRLKKGNHA